MHAHPLRLNPGQDLRLALDEALAGQPAPAAFVLAGMGSLGSVQLRLAGAAQPTAMVGDFEIISLSGSLSPDGAHLHIAVADARGAVYGGHVSPGCIVRTTAELLLAVLPGWRFRREHDPQTGYRELVIEPPPVEPDRP